MALTAWMASPAHPAAGFRVCGRARSDAPSLRAAPPCAAPPVRSLAHSFPGTVEPPRDLAADRRRVALQCRGTDVRRAGLQPGYRGLGGSHPRRDLGLREAGRLALFG